MIKVLKFLLDFNLKIKFNNFFIIGNCTIIEFKGKNFAKTPKVFIDEKKKSDFERLDRLASLCK